MFRKMMQDSLEGKCANCERQHKHKHSIKMIGNNQGTMHVTFFFHSKRCAMEWWVKVLTS